VNKYSSDISRRYSEYNKQKQELIEILKLYLQAIKRRRKTQQLSSIKSKTTPIYEGSITNLVLYLQQHGQQLRNREIALSKDELKSLIDRCVDFIIKSYRCET